jgi:hypothetical protein
MGSALTSIIGGIFDVKHYLHLQVRVLIRKTERLFAQLAIFLQLVPHVSRNHQVSE